jgi:hypothetical protein
MIADNCAAEKPGWFSHTFDLGFAFHLLENLGRFFIGRSCCHEIFQREQAETVLHRPSLDVHAWVVKRVETDSVQPGAEFFIP